MKILKNWLPNLSYMIYPSSTVRLKLSGSGSNPLEKSGYNPARLNYIQFFSVNCKKRIQSIFFFNFNFGQFIFSLNHGVRFLWDLDPVIKVNPDPAFGGKIIRIRKHKNPDTWIDSRAGKALFVSPDPSRYLSLNSKVQYWSLFFYISGMKLQHLNVLTRLNLNFGLQCLKICQPRFFGFKF